ncbi:hypothetical protein SAE02_61230 [Skermanella aerolata]|uniref:Uncharacterized protein n=1 Tax=Skermanella aerolata TaxID=393310 RepID=A0A512DZV5_9PROT|nr:hypothetical protein [Skermanella aerolata]KJB91921.1 hypothetical protein N826_25730 [Skermanella aerolata KACC 11604]GEO41975.1 hypothetical protein SAE02_61230 [Skermanella aerolata]
MTDQQYVEFMKRHAIPLAVVLGVLENVGILSTFLFVPIVLGNEPLVAALLTGSFGPLVVFFGWYVYHSERIWWRYQAWLRRRHERRIADCGWEEGGDTRI